MKYIVATALLLVVSAGVWSAEDSVNVTIFTLADKREIVAKNVLTGNGIIIATMLDGAKVQLDEKEITKTRTSTVALNTVADGAVKEKLLAEKRQQQERQDIAAAEAKLANATKIWRRQVESAESEWRAQAQHADTGRQIIRDSRQQLSIAEAALIPAQGRMTLAELNFETARAGLVSEYDPIQRQSHTRRMNEAAQEKAAAQTTLLQAQAAISEMNRRIISCQAKLPEADAAVGAALENLNRVRAARPK